MNPYDPMLSVAASLAEQCAGKLCAATMLFVLSPHYFIDRVVDEADYPSVDHQAAMRDLLRKHWAKAAWTVHLRLRDVGVEPTDRIGRGTASSVDFAEMVAADVARRGPIHTAPEWGQVAYKVLEDAQARHTTPQLWRVVKTVAPSGGRCITPPHVIWPERASTDFRRAICAVRDLTHLMVVAAFERHYPVAGSQSVVEILDYELEQNLYVLGQVLRWDLRPPVFEGSVTALGPAREATC